MKVIDLIGTPGFYPNDREYALTYFKSFIMIHLPVSAKILSQILACDDFLELFNVSQSCLGVKFKTE
jgi:hypothetical protein